MSPHLTSPFEIEIRNDDIKVLAIRGNGGPGGAVEFTLPCGQKRRMTGTQAKAFVARIRDATAWVDGKNDERVF